MKFDNPMFRGVDFSQTEIVMKIVRVGARLYVELFSGKKLGIRVKNYVHVIWFYITEKSLLKSR